jgi:hypothetical protein
VATLKYPLRFTIKAPPYGGVFVYLFIWSLAAVTLLADIARHILYSIITAISPT